MPTKQALKRKKNKERYSGTLIPNSPLQGSDQIVQPEQSEQYTRPHIQEDMDGETNSENFNSLGKPSCSGKFTFSDHDINANANIESLVEPLTPLSISSETCVPRKSRKMRDSSVESMDTQSVTSTIRSASVFSTSSNDSKSSRKAGRPRNTRKGVAGRARKIDDTTPVSVFEPKIQINEQDIMTDHLNIDFSSLNTLDFAINKTTDHATICRRAVMPLYERDTDNTGPRAIEVMWNNLSEWPNESFIFAYLCYLAKISGKKVIVVDPLITEPTHQQLPDLTYEQFSYQTDQDRAVQVLLLPVHLPGHWTIIIWDSEHGLYFLDSLPKDPHRLHELHANYHPDRLPKLIDIVSNLTNTPDYELQLGSFATDTYTLQHDGNSCGYFICLYAEAWLLNNRNLKFLNFNIDTEKKRILWHLNQLYSGDNVEYHPRIEQESFTILNLPSISQTTPRRASKLTSSSNLTPGMSNITVATPKGERVLPLTQRCHTKHKGIGCASFNSGHLPEYYNSGQFGDRTCEHCNNRLLLSEKCLSCTDGRVRLDPLKEYPKDYERLVSGVSMDSKEYIKDESKYNTLFAFGSLSVGRQNAPLGGPMPVLLNGEFSRRIGSLLADDHQIPSFDQLYILDSQIATDFRINNISFDDWNKKNRHLFHTLDELIRNNHPMASILENSYEFYKELEQTNPEQIQNFKIILVEDKNAPAEIQDPNLHPRQVNLPCQNESTVFAIWSSNTDEPPPLRGIWITNKGKVTELWPTHSMTDSILYPCMFLLGDKGYTSNIPYIKIAKSANISQDDFDDKSETGSIAESDSGSVDIYGDEPNRSRKNLSMRAFYRYRLGIRNPENETFHHIWSSGGGLGQKFLLDIAARIDSQVFEYLRKPEMDLRAELPQHLLDYMAKQGRLPSADNIGRVVLFRSYMPGFRAYFKKQYKFACTIINRKRKRGCAMFMFTFTSNPKWPEMKNELYPNGQLLIDRPDIIMRYYADKVRKVHKDLKERAIFGKQLGYAESMEFQKRGGPHFHRVMATDIPSIPEVIKDYIFAHIPALPNKDDKSPRAEGLRRLRDLVIKYQLHDCKPELCGQKNANGKCSKFFPYDYSDRTILHEDRPAVYYRPSPEDGGERVLIKKGGVTTEYTNAHVTPYNPFILLKYETHHNVLFAYGEKTNMKYTMKYSLKGPSIQYIQMQGDLVDIDEPAYYSQMYYRSATEAYARIHSMPYVRLSNTCYEMPIHLPDQQNVYFRPGQASAAAARIPQDLPKTMLTEYWKQWSEGKTWELIDKKWILTDDQMIKTTLYEQMPENYWFDKKAKIWKKRVNNKDVIGLIHPRPSPRDQEKFALYILLRHYPGDPEALKEVKGVIYTTFVEAARLRGLLSDDSVWERTLEEAAHFINPKEMRYLFVQVLVFGNPSNARELWDKFVDHMFKPIIGNDPNGIERKRRIDRALAYIEHQLSDYGMTNQQFNLDSPSPGMQLNIDTALDNFFFGDKDEDDFASGKKPDIILNDDQEKVWNTVQNAIQGISSNTIFVTGDGGTGKTYLFNTIISRLREMRIRVIASAFTGCAATLLTGGATVHSVFRFGINIDQDYTPSVSMQSFHGKRISESQVIIIDEVSMLPKHMLEAVDRVCKQMVPQTLRHLPFGGKVIILSGDFKQSLPVVAGGSMRDQVNACIQSSPLWPLFKNNLQILNINGCVELEMVNSIRK
ncbi:hypothetical protein ACQ4LE_011196 [Meloidogyne hapla]